MKYLVSFFAFQILFTLSVVNLYADTGSSPSSTTTSIDYLQQFDLTDLSDEEQEWFVTFIEGTFYAEGWQDIANDILQKLSEDERHLKEQQLNELGYKIGREWCKDNELRKIDTAMLKKWGELLKSTAQDDPQLLTSVIDHIDGEVTSIVD